MAEENLFIQSLRAQMRSIEAEEQSLPGQEQDDMCDMDAELLAEIKRELARLLAGEEGEADPAASVFAAQ